MTYEETLEQTLERAKNLRYKDEGELDDIKKKGTMALENLFALKTYSIDINTIQFAQYHYTIPTEYQKEKEWQDGQKQLINLLDTALLECKTRALQIKSKPIIPKEKIVIQEKIVLVSDDSAIHNLQEEFNNYRRDTVRWTIYSLLVIILTVSLWVLFANFKWELYKINERKVGITLMINLAIIVGLLNIPIRQKWTLWVPTVIAVLTTLFSIL